MPRAYKMVVIDENPSHEDLKNARLEAGARRVGVFTPSQIALFFKSPTIIHKINEKHDLDLPKDPKWVIRQVETDTAYLASTIEEPLHRSFFSEGLLASKIRGMLRMLAPKNRGIITHTHGIHINYSAPDLQTGKIERRVQELEFSNANDTKGKEVFSRDKDGSPCHRTEIGRRHGMIFLPQIMKGWNDWTTMTSMVRNGDEERPYDYHKDPKFSLERFLAQEGSYYNLKRAAFQVKGVLEDILYHHEGTEPSTNSVPVKNTWETPNKRLPFVDDLRRMLGDNISVLLYGSAAECNLREGKFNDYDLIVVVPELKPSHYNAIENKKMTYKGKRVGLVLVSEDVLPKFIIDNSYSIGIVRHSKLLYDGLGIPKVDLPSVEAAVERQVARLSGRIRVLNGVAMNADPNALYEMPQLFESCVKTSRFILQTAMDCEAYKRGELPDTKKQDVEAILEKEKVKKPRHAKSWERITNGLIQADRDTKRLIYKHFPIPEELKEPVAEVIARCGTPSLLKKYLKS